MAIIYEKGKEIMRTFDYRKLKNSVWNTEIVNYISQIRLLQGRQEQYLKRKPAELDKLVEIAKIQSTEASNAIEGIRTTNTRLKQIVENRITPKNRDEEEIAGYRDALNVIHENFEYISLTPNYILQLHQILYSHNAKKPIGGKFKSVQNYISATDEQGITVNIFTPLAPFETPAAVEQICNEFNQAVAYMDVDPLILIPIFIHDFLCIHPFLDGNGRMSRLLTTLLLYRCGFYVGKYISLEAKIANYKDLYYDALKASQEGWHEGKDDCTPFIKYLLMIILSAYRDFEERVEIVSEKSSAIEIVRTVVNKKIGKFKKAEIIELCPSLSASAIEKALKELTDKGEITKHASGKNTFYNRND